MKFWMPVEADLSEMNAEVFAYAKATIDAKEVQRVHDFCTVPLNMIVKYGSLTEVTNRYGMKPLYAMAFRCAPHSRGLIHRDLDAYALNISLGEPGGYQVWVDVEQPPVLTNYGDTNAKPFELYTDDTPRKEIARFRLDSTHLVRTNYLHYVDNMDNHNWRYTLTMRFSGILNPLD